MDEKIQAKHRERTAYVYVRQSSPQQVRRHSESRECQYALRERTLKFGFHQVVTIDDDLGKTGSGSKERPGFARLLTAVCEGAAGAVFASEATRLARNNRDWHHLIDLCALTETLVIDTDGVYDPRLLNDRLLLGMKGNLAEFELNLIRQRAHEARQQMIHRGAVLWEVPVGYVRTDDYRVELVPDRQVQDAIRGVFRKFRELGSARQVLLWYRQEELQLPQAKPGTAGREITWERPVYGRIIKILKNPCYAGAFAYGKTRTKTIVRDGRGQNSPGHPLPLDQWAILMKDHHEGYISWKQYLKNQQILEQNTAMRGDGTSGAAKTGAALLAGLLRCARCGRMLHVAYSGTGGNVPRYWCRGANINHGGSNCLSVGGLRLDRAVAAEAVRAVEPLRVQAAIEAQQRLQNEEDHKRRSLELALEKARYEADRARRQYDRVEPENRLVAAELEARWNDALRQVERYERRLAELPASGKSPTDTERRRLFELGDDLQQLWNHSEADPALKKRLLRALLREIVIDTSSEPPEMILRIHWAGGVHSELRVPKNKTGMHRRCADRTVVELIRELAKICKDQSTAAILNRLGYRTGTGKSWTESRVRGLRNSHGIPAAYRTERDTWCTLEQAAEELGVSKTVVRRLINRQILPANQVVACAPWVIDRKDLELSAVQEAVHAVRAGRKLPRTLPSQQKLPLNS